MFISPERRCIDPHTCLIRALVGNEMFALELDMQVVEGGGKFWDKRRGRMSQRVLLEP